MVKRRKLRRVRYLSKMTKDAMNDIATSMENSKERKVKVNEKLSLSSALPSPITPVHSDNSSLVRISLP